MSRKEGPPNRLENLQPLTAEMYFGPWVPLSKVPNKKSLGGALDPHIQDINGTPSIPIRLVTSLRKAR